MNAGYPADLYPGGRQIDTPYGSIRAYVTGPESGERVLLIHSITTPSSVFQGIVPRLVKAGYRVCTLDLWGRGYRDSPDLIHYDRLFCFQILSVLHSIGWSSETGYRIVGYSLGGCLGACFTSFYPIGVKGLIMIAPAGLLARKQLPLSRKIAINRNVPAGLDMALQSYLVPKRVEEAKQMISGDSVNVVRVLEWQQKNHKGFARSYLSTFREAPLFDQFDMIKRLKMHENDVKMFAIWGDRDDIVETKLVSSRLQNALPDMELKLIDKAGHDVVTPKPVEICEELFRMLKL